MTEATRIGRLVGVSLNPAIDKIAAVEALRPGRIHRPEMLAAVPGGKALNAVRTARHLGLPADVVAVVGGHAGAWLAAELDARGIHHWLVWVEGETRTCLSVLDRQTGDLTEFYEAGIALSEDRWPSVETALGEALDDDADATVVLLAGSLPPGAPLDAYRLLARVGRDAGARVVVDIGGPALEVGARRATLARQDQRGRGVGDHRHRDGRPGRRPRGRARPARSRRGLRADHDGHRRCRARHGRTTSGWPGRHRSAARTAWAVATPFSAGWSWHLPEAPTCPRPSATARRPRPRTRSCPARVSLTPPMSTVSCLAAC